MRSRRNISKDKNMRNISTYAFCYLIVAILYLLSFTCAENNTTHSRVCDISDLNLQCGKNERCINKENEKKSTCQCLLDYEFVKGQCVETAPIVRNSTAAASSDLKPESGSSVAAGLLIPIFLIAVGGLLYFGARRYKWLQRFRQYRQNRYGNVLVTRDDDDDDDPPIA
ncbi:uncharacterized protein [Prorops nasuta]|uniref:uncharacterized protein n=1 Tax=Prorops nasuta TaxID=863751 RepID=UPI0034CD9D36